MRRSLPAWALATVPRLSAWLSVPHSYASVKDSASEGLIASALGSGMCRSASEME
jgi:hypothetical protein